MLLCLSHISVVKHDRAHEQGGSHLLNKRISFESKLIIIVQVCELLLGNLNATGAGDVVDTAFLKKVIEHVTLVVETCCTNLTTVVEQIDTEQLSFSVLVMPRLDVGLAGATGLDGPLVGVRRDGFNGVDGCVCRCGGTRRLSSIGLLCWGTWDLGAVKAIAGDRGRLGLLFLFGSRFQGLWLSDLLRLTQFFQNLKVQDDQDSKNDQ